MIKNLLGDTYRAGLANISLQDLKEPADTNSSVELTFHDSIEWKKLTDRLRIECTRSFAFEPECNFRLKITYFIEHFLKESGSLDKLTDEEIKKEIFEDMDFYLQTSQGFASRLSMLASQITSTFGGTPAVTPPIFPFEKNEANGNDL